MSAIWHQEKLFIACYSVSSDTPNIDMCFDLEEYMDWYFDGTTHRERKEYAEQLQKDWVISSS